MTTTDMNAALAAAGQQVLIKRHTGAGSFYIVSTRWTGPAGKRINDISYDPDGQAILNSSMSLEWVRDWAATRLRDAARRAA